jgi:hypothetical protein
MTAVARPLFIFLTVICLFEPAYGGEKIAVALDPLKVEYVAREPVKFRVVLSNISSEPVHVPEVRFYDMNMEFFQLRIVPPGENEEIRKFRYKSAYGIANENYGGELLMPGDSIQSFLYPNVTYLVDDGRLVDPGPTFAEPGQYEVQVCYTVPAHQKVLYTNEAREICSNTVILTFRRPDDVEAEIVDAIWDDSTPALSMGDNSPFPPFNISSLRAILERYPDHELSSYVRFALARSLVSISTAKRTAEANEAIELLEPLRDTDFRYFDEVCLHLSVALFVSGDQATSLRVLEQLFDERPALRSDYRTMSRYLIQKTQDPMSIERWQDARKGKEPKTSPTEDE